MVGFLRGGLIYPIFWFKFYKGGLIYPKNWSEFYEGVTLPYDNQRGVREFSIRNKGYIISNRNEGKTNNKLLQTRPHF